MSAALSPTTAAVEPADLESHDASTPVVMPGGNTHGSLGINGVEATLSGMEMPTAADQSKP